MGPSHISIPRPYHPARVALSPTGMEKPFLVQTPLPPHEQRNDSMLGTGYVEDESSPSLCYNEAGGDKIGKR